MAAVGGPAMNVSSAFAEDDLRAQILQIPGVGKGQPTDADFQKVGALTLVDAASADEETQRIEREDGA